MGIVGTDTDCSPWDMGGIADPVENVCWVTPKGLASSPVLKSKLSINSRGLGDFEGLSHRGAILEATRALKSVKSAIFTNLCGYCS